MQYDLFECEELAALRQQVEKHDLKLSNLRRGLFSRFDELRRVVEDLREELAQVKQIQASKKAELVPFFGEYLEVTK